MRLTQARILRSLLLLACSCFSFGLFMIGLRIPFLFIVIAGGMAWNRARHLVGSGWSHGTARLSGVWDLIRHKLMGEEGLILGTTAMMPRPSLKDGITALCSSSYPAGMACYLFLYAVGGTKWVGERMIRINDFIHLATFAPTGRGKGISVLVPNLRSYPHSCVVTDPKGELYMLTAGIRYHKLGNRIFRLDPFGVCGPDVPATDRMNPLDAVNDKAPDFLDQCRDIADMMIMQSGKEPDPYWNDSARGVLTAFIAYVCACEENWRYRTIDTVRDLLSGRETFHKAVELMQSVESHGGVIKRLGHSMTWHVDEELASVLSNVQRHTEAFDSPVVATNLGWSTFNPLFLRMGRATVYLCLPHDKLETLAPLMRLWIGVIIRVITRGQPTEKNPVLFFLDEAAHLGKIRVLEQAVTLMRGMGIRLWFVFQSLHQVQDCFGEKAKTILDNIDTQQYFAINDYDNAEAISKKMGDRTITTSSRGKNSSRSRSTGGNGQDSGSVSSGDNINHSDTGRRLFKPEELMVLPDDVALVFHKNMPVIQTRLLKYFNHPSFRGGGTGLQPGLGSVATEKAVCLLIACFLFGVFTLSIPPLNIQPVRQVRHMTQADRQKAIGRNPRSSVPRSELPALPDGWVIP